MLRFIGRLVDRSAARAVPARSVRPQLEHLETREVPATFNIPWADPGHLTLSFVPDGTPVSTLTSSLHSTMNAVQPPSVWQTQILRAFQTWASVSNINVSLAADSGAAMGITGPIQGDARFGDIRIGAVPLAPSSIAVSVPPDPFYSGTWAGDLLFNSNANFGPGGTDLFTVALHEAGHILGIDHSASPESVMYHHFTQARTGLAPRDIVSVQTLYGARAPDAWEGRTGNATFKTATRIRYENTGPSIFLGQTPLITYGDITAANDVDLYSLQPFVGYSGRVTFRLQSAGKSLLAPRMEVLDSAGRLLGSATSSSTTGDTLSVSLNQVNPASTYYVRVQGAARGRFDVGGYALATTFDNTLATPLARIDEVIRGPYESLDYKELQALFGAGEHLLNDDHGANDTFLTATRLTPALGYAANTHYEVIASLAATTDVDLYQLRSPSFGRDQARFLTASVWSLEASADAPQIVIYDRNMIPVAAQILANGNGTFTVQAAGIESNKGYFVGVQRRNGLGGGNYSMSLNFGAQAASLPTLAAESLLPTQPTQTYNLYIAKPQLFHFLLSSQSTAPLGTGNVQMTILDSTGSELFRLTAGVGDAVSAPGMLLKPGSYRVRFDLIPVAGQATIPLSFALKGINEIVPIGPVANDPSFQTQFSTPGDPTAYTYPGGITSLTPFLMALLTL